MKKGNKMNLVDEFESNNLSIEYVGLFDYLTEPIIPDDVLYDILNDIDEEELIRLFGKKVAQNVLDDDPDIATYLKEDVGGVFIMAEARLPDASTVEFCPDGTPRRWFLSPYVMALYAIGPDVNSAIETIIQKAKKIKKAVFDNELTKRNMDNEI